MRRNMNWRHRMYSILIACGLSATVWAEPLIVDLVEFGAIDEVPAYFTGQVFDHPEFGEFEVGVLDEDVPFFVDRTHEYQGLTEELTLESLDLVGAEIVMSANDNRGAADYELEVTISQAVDAFVFMDTRVTQPEWLANDDWQFLGHRIGIDEGADGIGPGQGINQSFWIWKKSFSEAGTFNTFERGGTGNNMYGIAVMEPGRGPDAIEIELGDYVIGNFGFIDIGALNGRGEADGLIDEFDSRQIGGGNHNENGLDLLTTTVTSKFGDEFTIAIEALDETETPVGGLDWRDRGDSPLALVGNAPLIAAGEDLVKNNQGVIRVTLGDLPAGDYEVTSFHLDPDFDQSESIEIFVDNGDGEGFVSTDEFGNADFLVGGVGGLTVDNLLQTSATFRFTADGTNDVMILFDGRFAGDTEVPLNGLDIRLLGAGVEGDYNGNGILDVADLDLQSGQLGTNNAAFDLTNDGAVDQADRLAWVKDLAGTWIGDANLDGEFNSGDFVQVFSAGLFETQQAATWSQGDWNGDGFFDSGDFVAAFTDGGFELGPRGAVSAVPEPNGWLLLLGGLPLALRRKR
ncbi:MAG: hypothetical protein R3C28_16740 [Pirellulaceae bacterium]